ncbi:MAG: sigma-70 family RNA polymerase sigma factor [Pseudomonadota bacterium]
MKAGNASVSATTGTAGAGDAGAGSDRIASAALRSLYADHAEALTAYLRKAFGDGPPDPSDVVQEAFQKLVERRDLSGIANPRAFLWRIARNAVLTHKRNKDARSRYDFEIEHLFFADDGANSTPERVLEVKQQLLVINETLQRMPPRRRKAFLWHRVEGLNFTEVGKRLGVNRHAVVRHITKAAFDIEAALEGRPERKS